jgi:hypothetical protein
VVSSLPAELATGPGGSQILFFWWGWSLNSGLCTYKAGTLLLEAYLQSILLWLFWRWGSGELFAQVSLKSWSSWSQPSE